MILLFALVIFTLRLLYLFAEIFFERDWPRNTWRGLALSIALVAMCIFTFA